MQAPRSWFGGGFVRAIGPVVAGAVALGLALGQPQHARADGDAEAAEQRERCAIRLSIAFLGQTPPADMLGAAKPQDVVDALLARPGFHDRFARFVNAQWNPEPGEKIEDEPAYTLARFVLANGKLPWKEMFVGKYDIGASVSPDPDGLGYFRSAAWMKRYEGNEEAGYRLVAAYRILQNTTGLELTATTNVEGVDLTADGRKGDGCKGCHYDGWFALDRVAKVLSRKNLAGDAPAYVPPSEGAQEILGGQKIGSDAELVNALVASKNFAFSTCRLAFQFLYGRAENTCEGQVFDRCIDAFEATGTVQSALAAVAKDPSFCQ